MGRIIKDFVFTSYVFWICLAFSLFLLLAGFLMPPMAQIDNSVLKAVAEIGGFATLGVFLFCVKEGITAKFSKGDMSVEVTKENTNN